MGDHRSDDSPTATERNDTTPAEIIERYAAGDIDETELFARLLGMEFTLGQFDPTGGDGYIRGSWDDVHSAVGRGLLTDEQYARLVREARFVYP